MTASVKLPSLGESVESARVLSVKVKPGDRIEAEDPVIEVETDKATLEVPSEESGIVDEVLVSEGDDVETGQELVRLRAGDEDEGGDASGGSEAPEDEEEQEPEPQQQKKQRPKQKQKQQKQQKQEKQEKQQKQEQQEKQQKQETQEQQEKQQQQEKGDRKSVV